MRRRPSHLVWVLRVDVYLLVLFKPGVHRAEGYGDEPLQVPINILRSSRESLSVADDNVINLVFLVLGIVQSFREVLLGDV